MVCGSDPLRKCAVEVEVWPVPCEKGKLMPNIAVLHVSFTSQTRSGSVKLQPGLDILQTLFRMAEWF